MILGAYGEVGIYITKIILGERPRKVCLTSLKEKGIRNVVKEVSPFASGLCELIPL
ncbi:MAG: hypothetical protein N2513_05075 [Deltaproteobacteria bacterium]|nr:hypothetical protein [Deltaproteobacteria bacterium]